MELPAHRLARPGLGWAGPSDDGAGQIGDRLGGAEAFARQQFAPPTLEAVVEPVDPGAGNRLRLALEQLSEQDPLIGLRQSGRELSVSIYGDVQKEVLEATSANYLLCVFSYGDMAPQHAMRSLELFHGEVMPRL